MQTKKSLPPEGAAGYKIEGWGLPESGAPRKTEAEFSRSKAAVDASGRLGQVVGRTGHENGLVRAGPVKTFGIKQDRVVLADRAPALNQATQTTQVIRMFAFGR